MASEKKTTNIVNNNTAAWGFPSFVAYVGAAAYFVSITDGTFWAFVGALLKALVWPGFVVFHVLKLLGV
ncbi:hypothetical protein EOL96_06430 [Candidatus Saccharibacteria bacterium]|nr:hypothetical protein [Candidatus Saccharibacteria bacterium]